MACPFANQDQYIEEEFPEILPEIINVSEEYSSFPLSVGHGSHNIGHNSSIGYHKYHGEAFSFYAPLKYPVYNKSHNSHGHNSHVEYVTEAFKLTAVPYGSSHGAHGSHGNSGYYYIYYDSSDKNSYSHYHQSHSHLSHGKNDHYKMQYLTYSFNAHTKKYGVHFSVHKNSFNNHGGHNNNKHSYNDFALFVAYKNSKDGSIMFKAKKFPSMVLYADHHFGKLELGIYGHVKFHQDRFYKIYQKHFIGHNSSHNSHKFNGSSHGIHNSHNNHGHSSHSTHGHNVGQNFNHGSHNVHHH